MKTLTLILAAVLALATPAQTTQPTTRPAQPARWIGVDKQPIASFQKWIDRGVNLFVGAEPNDRPAETAAWEDELERRGVWFMSYPSEDPERFAAQCRQRYRAAWMQADEPDTNRFGTNGSNYPLPGWGWTPPDVLAARYARCKAASPLPVFVNFAGPNVTPTGDAWKYPAYVRSADWLGHDWYVFNRGQTDTRFIGEAIDRLRSWSRVVDNADRPQFAYIECSAQKLRDYPAGRAPTPDEMEAEVNLAIGKGATGIIYFPQQINGGFQYDATTPEMQARMRSIAARLNGPVTVPTPTDSPALLAIVKALDAAQAETRDTKVKLEALAAQVKALRDDIQADRAATLTLVRTPATQPATQPSR
jgi:hypothetical protein